MTHSSSLHGLRQATGATQKQLAELFDVSPSVISNCEGGKQLPTLPLALAYEVLFGEPCAKMFARLYAQIEEQVMTRSVRLESAVRGKHDEASVRIRSLLTGMSARARNADGA